jgi:hypothetical protein
MRRLMLVSVFELFSVTAYAQPAPNLCTWAGRDFSQGAQFCMGPNLSMQCNNGVWTPVGNPVCSNAPTADAK